MVDIIIHVADHLLALVDERVRSGEFASRCHFMSKAVRWYLTHLDSSASDGSINEEVDYKGMDVNKTSSKALKR